MTDYLVPILLVLSSSLALIRGKRSYEILLQGCTEGLQLIKTILPSLVLLLTALQMFQVSGAADTVSRLLAPFFRLLGIPPECALLVLIRPISGSAAMAAGAGLMAQYGVDSLIGRTAAVMLGSTETTFYTISVYFGAAGIRDTRYALPAALIADLTGFTAAALCVRFLF